MVARVEGDAPDAGEAEDTAEDLAILAATRLIQSVAKGAPGFIVRIQYRTLGTALDAWFKARGEDDAG